MSRKNIRTKLRNRERRIKYRLRERIWEPQDEPMFTARNIHYDLSGRFRALGSGGIGGIHLLSRRVGLIDAIDRNLHLLRIHRPYHESDHVLNIAYNLLCGGECLEHIERRRTDEVYLDALGAQRIPDPTTEGDFCRRFEETDVEGLMDTINEVRLGVWRLQPDAFFDRAIIDGDGTMAPTTGECKQGMDISYNGQWGYHPLVVSLANTGSRFTWSTGVETARPTKGRLSDTTGRSSYVDERASVRSYCGETRTSARPHTWTRGTPKPCGSLLVLPPCRT